MVAISCEPKYKKTSELGFPIWKKELRRIQTTLGAGVGVLLGSADTGAETYSGI